jgi:hypothetical protein
MDLVVQVRMAEEKSADRCAYLFCQNDACGCADFDFTMLEVHGLSATSPLCQDHVAVLRHRVEKRRNEALDSWRATAARQGNPELCRKLRFLKRKLLESPARRDAEALSNALAQIQSVLGLDARSGKIANVWIGLQLALQEARKRRWNARRTAEWAEVVAFYEGLCAYCGKAQWAHVDHVVPLSKGGEDAICNAVPACMACNLRKSDVLGWKPIRPHRLLVIQENRSGMVLPGRSGVAAVA